MKILELFAGKQSFANVARSAGHEVFTSDILALDGIDYAVPIADFDPARVPFLPDMIWASPECKAFSTASGGFHFRLKNGRYEAQTEYAGEALAMVNDCLRVVNHFLKLNPNLIFYIENPVGLIQKLTDLRPNWLFSPFPIPRCVKIDQCAFGRDAKKPTWIFTNDIRFRGRKCAGATCHHVRNMTASFTALSSLKASYYKRAALPPELCTDILASATAIYSSF